MKLTMERMAVGTKDATSARRGTGPGYPQDRENSLWEGRLSAESKPKTEIAPPEIGRNAGPHSASSTFGLIPETTAPGHAVNTAILVKGVVLPMGFVSLDPVVVLYPFEDVPGHIVKLQLVGRKGTHGHGPVAVDAGL